MTFLSTLISADNLKAELINSPSSLTNFNAEIFIFVRFSEKVSVTIADWPFLNGSQ